ncbi:MAG: benzoate-CoA ligase family protein [Deltaproteobacteria bacterium]|nr:benzoate-CoA ligase family protein [Deltaproteobacteria bacterium]
MNHPLQLPPRFNVADHFLAPLQGAEFGSRPYMICGDEKLTFGELPALSNRVGNALRRLGVRPEERVALLMRETLAFPPVFWGTVRMGAVAVPLNPALNPRDYAYYLEDSRAACLVVDGELLEKAAPALSRLAAPRQVIVAGATAGARQALRDYKGEVHLLDELTAGESGEMDAEPMGPDMPAFWLYTSGSTGSPKGAIHSHRSMVWAAEHYMKQVLGLNPGETTLSAPKFYFAYGLGNSLYAPLALGTTAIIQTDVPTPHNCFRLLARHRPAVFYAVPSLLNAMLRTYRSWLRGEDDPPAEIPRLEHLRFVVSAGETLPLSLYHGWREHFSHPLLDGIGSTEMLHFYVANRPDAQKPGSTGIPVPGYQVRLMDTGEGIRQEVPEGEQGELWVRGGSMAAGYWNKLERSRGVFQGEWLATGDLFHQDASGFFYYHGRLDDMMKIGGSWVAPAEVEEALLSHNQVAECAVVGHYDDDGLMKSHAYVVPSPLARGLAVLPDSLLEHLDSLLPRFKIPFQIHIVDTLPRTASGKIRRFMLRGKRPPPPEPPPGSPPCD